MSRKYKFHNPDGIYFITYTVVNCIDVFTRIEYRNVLIDSWKYCQKQKGLEIYAWVIMTNHVHMIVGSLNNQLSEIIGQIKSFTSTELHKHIENNPKESRKQWMLSIMKDIGEKNKNNNDFQFWQQHNQPVELSSNYLMDQKLDYIHNNPVVAGFVENPEDYAYSSARDYAGGKGMIDIVLIQ